MVRFTLVYLNELKIRKITYILSLQIPIYCLHSLHQTIDLDDENQLDQTLSHLFVKLLLVGEGPKGFPPNQSHQFIHYNRK
jgi:hypothetical protein